MISAICWVPRGVSKSKPEPAEPSPEELAVLQAGAFPCMFVHATGVLNSSIGKREGPLRSCIHVVFWSVASIAAARRRMHCDGAMSFRRRGG